MKVLRREKVVAQGVVKISSADIMLSKKINIIFVYANQGNKDFFLKMFDGTHEYHLSSL